MSDVTTLAIAEEKGKIVLAFPPNSGYCKLEPEQAWRICQHIVGILDKLPEGRKAIAGFVADLQAQSKVNDQALAIYIAQVSHIIKSLLRQDKTPDVIAVDIVNYLTGKLV